MEDAKAIGRTFGTMIRRAGGSKVATGYDGRVSSPMLEAGVIEGLNEAGVDAVSVGLGPTPMLYYAATTLGVDGGIMVTGSHNPERKSTRLNSSHYCADRIPATA